MHMWADSRAHAVAPHGEPAQCPSLHSFCSRIPPVRAWHSTWQESTRGTPCPPPPAAATTAVFASGFAPPQLLAWVDGASSLYANNISSVVVNAFVQG